MPAGGSGEPSRLVRRHAAGHERRAGPARGKVPTAKTGHAYLSVIARRLRLLDSNELNALLDQAEDAGIPTIERSTRVVAGEIVPTPVTLATQDAGVWTVTNGHTVSPEDDIEGL